MSARRRIYEQLSMADGAELTAVSKTIFLIILFSIVWTVVESEPTLSDGHEPLFLMVNYIFAAFFLAEYVVRLFAAGEAYPGFAGRIRYMCSLPALVDLLAFAPFLFWPEVNALFVFRILRVLRFIAVDPDAKEMRLIVAAIKNRRNELQSAIVATLLVIFLSAACLYMAEAKTQPEQFGSIPRALWWAFVTLTTIGYGDAIPMTVAGKIMTMIIAIASICFVALPTGIVAAGFSEALHQTKEKGDES